MYEVPLRGVFRGTWTFGRLAGLDDDAPVLLRTGVAAPLPLVENLIGFTAGVLLFPGERVLGHRESQFSEKVETLLAYGTLRIHSH